MNKLDAVRKGYLNSTPPVKPPVFTNMLLQICDDRPPL